MENLQTSRQMSPDNPGLSLSLTAVEHANIEDGEKEVGEENIVSTPKRVRNNKAVTKTRHNLPASEKRQPLDHRISSQGTRLDTRSQHTRIQYR